MGGNSTTGTKEPQKGQLAVSPATATLRGGDTQTFSAAEGGATAAPAVAWSVNGVAGGNATTGTISAAGVYVAPEFPPTGGAVTITAVETADATKTAGSAVTVNNPIPQVTTVAPTSIPVGTFTLTVNGTHFATGAAVQFGSSALTTTRVSSTKLTATGTATSAEVGNVSVMVKNPDPGSVNSATVTAKVVNSGPITVAVAPATVTVRPGVNQSFTATVTGTSNTALTWTINGLDHGSATIGYINPQVGYTPYAPPGIVPNPNTVTCLLYTSDAADE